MAAKKRGESLDHVSLHGPPGSGKTTLSHIIANELESSLKITTGPYWTNLQTWRDCYHLEDGIPSIDEIHRLHPIVEEYLYSAHGGLPD